MSLMYICSFVSFVMVWRTCSHENGVCTTRVKWGYFVQGKFTNSAYRKVFHLLLSATSESINRLVKIVQEKSVVM